MISTVVFDADETSIDLRPAVRGALAAVLEEMLRNPLDDKLWGLSMVRSDKARQTEPGVRVRCMLTVVLCAYSAPS